MVYGRVTSHQCTIAVQSDCFLWLGIDIIEMTAEEAGTLGSGEYTGGGPQSQDKTLSIICSKTPVLATTTTTTISDSANLQINTQQIREC